MKQTRIPAKFPCLLLPFATAVVLFISRVANAAYPDLILSDHPVAYYRLEETSGSTAIDSSTNGLNANYIFDTGQDGTFPELGLPGITTNSVFLKYYTDSNSLVHFGDI